MDELTLDSVWFAVALVFGMAADSLWMQLCSVAGLLLCYKHWNDVN